MALDTPALKAYYIGVMADTQRLSAVNHKVRKAEAYRTFCDSRRNGLNIMLSSTAAGVSRITGGRWEKQRMAELESGEGFAGPLRPILARDQLAAILSASVERCEDQYRANMATALSRVMGYDAPTRQQIEVRQIPASVMGWLETVDAIDAHAEPVLDSPAQPKPLQPKPDTP